MPDIFGGLTLEDLREHWEAQDKPYMAAWQCPGCGTIYNFTVPSCGCQRRNLFTSATTTNPQKPALTCEDVGCRCGKKDGE